jgi:hypothetical protein
MRYGFWKFSPSFGFALALAGAGAALAQADKPSAPVESEVGCATPVHAGESAKELSKRFGGDAKIEEVDGAEGEKVKAFVLFPKDKARRVEVSFDDDAMAKATGLRWSGQGNKWNVAGVAVGSDVKAVRAANGAPFSINGFGWDYGGYAANFRAGKLGKLPGGCSVSLRFDHEGKDPPAALSGDGVHISSDDAKLAAFAPVVTEIAINFH